MHDAVAQRDFEPTLPPVPDRVLEEEDDSFKIVSLVKTKEPLVKHVKRDLRPGRFAASVFGKAGGRGCQNLTLIPLSKNVINLLLLNPGERANNPNRLPERGIGGGAPLGKRDLFSPVS